MNPDKIAMLRAALRGIALQLAEMSEEGADLGPALANVVTARDELTRVEGELRARLPEGA